MIVDGYARYLDALARVFFQGSGSAGRATHTTGDLAAPIPPGADRASPADPDNPAAWLEELSDAGERVYLREVHGIVVPEPRPGVEL